MTSQDNKDIWTIVKLVFLAGLALLLLSGIGLAVRWALWPVEKRVERAVFVESHQYQEARKEAIFQLESEISRINVRISETDDPEVRQAFEGQLSVLKNRLARERAKER